LPDNKEEEDIMAGSPPSTEKSRLELPEIQKLIKMIERSPITEFELVEKDLRIRISKNGHERVVGQMISAPQTFAPMAQMSSVAGKADEAELAPAGKSTIVEIKSPMVGTFYRAPAPDADPYIRVGDIVDVGRVLCIVEAMKLMNEIECEIHGKIIEILVENAHPVEFGQTLFRVDTSAV
jgi:acetyl-CoA carboxylase biotin carboxyl carrier protein